MMPVGATNHHTGITPIVYGELKDGMPIAEAGFSTIYAAASHANMLARLSDKAFHSIYKGKK